MSACDFVDVRTVVVSNERLRISNHGGKKGMALHDAAVHHNDSGELDKRNGGGINFDVRLLLPGHVRELKDRLRAKST